MDTPEAILGIQLAEAGCTTEAMRTLIKGQGLVVLLNNGLIQVLMVKADMEGCIGPAGVKEVTHLAGLVTRAMTLSTTMSSRVFSVWLQYSKGTIFQACWIGGIDRSVQMI